MTCKSRVENSTIWEIAGVFTHNAVEIVSQKHHKILPHYYTLIELFKQGNNLNEVHNLKYIAYIQNEYNCGPKSKQI